MLLLKGAHSKVFVSLTNGFLCSARKFRLYISTVAQILRAHGREFNWLNVRK